ncbi:hypothetical protein [Mucilaginibacter sp. FT3.2]|uniref:hypothetical protein n=1 Tax=Mucilaginibacter sp. FT3.2 TaxID=2723090 RepID=UPI0016101AC7|nr:hypothetical protein [Mucilaginibacter sp. FT3.2]MBB6229954.1 hypothetical protein [Mucilaginibacter sp. FT3.2]
MKQKGPKNSSQQKCFFAHRAFALQNGQNLGWNYFALTLFALAAKTSYALPPHNPALFWPFSPEAVLLTGNREAFVKQKSAT